ncbi:MAG: ydaF 4 [Bacteroidetes bacterium]|nr:ydaF 4 [Bacteroidota bacterium]
MLTLNFDPFPVLETERLLLKRIVASDAQDLFIIRSNKETMRFIPRPVAKTIEDALALIELIDAGIISNERINWGMHEKSANKLIGIVGYHHINTSNARAEVGYVLNADYHKKGLMQEALAKVLNYGFEVLKFNCIEAIVDPENVSSLRVMEKANFVKEGCLRDYTYHNEKYSDAFIFSKLKRES